MVPCCLSTQAVRQVSRMNRIDQMESNGLNSTKSSEMVKWCLMYSSVSTTSKRNRMIKTRIRQISLPKIIVYGGEAVSYKFYFTRQLHVNLNTYLRKKVFENEANALFDNISGITIVLLL